MVGLYKSELEELSMQEFLHASQAEGIPSSLVEKFLALIRSSRQSFAVDAEKALLLLKNSEEQHLPSLLRVSKIKFSGTDGMRGLVSNQHQAPLQSVQLYRAEGLLTPLFCYVMVRAFIQRLKGTSRQTLKRICVGEDGRDVSARHPLLPSIAAAIEDEGWVLEYAGVVPTPAIAAYSLEQQSAAVMITASHNPAPYNGIKFFIDGRKLYPQGELGEYALTAQALQLASSLGETFQVARNAVPPVSENALRLLTDSIVADLSDAELATLKLCSITLDCAHGAVAAWYEQVFQKLGLFIEVLNSVIIEGSINNGSGAAYLDGLLSIKREGPYPLALARRMVEKQTLDNKTQFGIAVDGDADRGLLLVLEPDSPHIQILQGDEILMLMIGRLLGRGRTESVVSCTIESDPNTMQCLKHRFPQIEVRQKSVGDRWLVAGVENSLLCGAEDSGHVVYPVQVGTRTLYTGNGLAVGLTAIANYQTELLSSCSRIGIRKAVVKPVATQFWYEGSALFEQVRHSIEEVFTQDVERVVFEEDADVLAYRLNGAELLYARASGTEPKLQFVYPHLRDDRFEKVVQAFRMACEPFQK